MLKEIISNPLFILFAIILGLNLVTNAQEPEDYVVTTKKKTYSKLLNPLIKNTQPVEVTVVNGQVYLEGDIWLGSEQFLDSRQVTTFSVTTDANPIHGRWENGVVPFVIMDGFTSAERQVIINAMNHIAERTRVSFRPRTNQFHFIKFKKYTDEELGWHGGQSYLGKCVFCTDGQEIKLSNVANRTVRHEIGHALGLNHEQTREDRDEFIEILWDNIEPDQKGNFNQNNAMQTDVGNYDFDSIMHYGSRSFGKKVNGKRKQTIRRKSNPSDTDFGTTSVLSSGDIAGINSMYRTDQNLPLLTNLLPGELEIGESKTKTIRAKEAYNYTGIYLRQGQKFEFTVASPEWNNGNRETTANGYEGSLMDTTRRHPDLKVMALVGEIFTQNNNSSSYTGTYFRIGTSRTLTATKSGFLVTFANDCLACYGDNSRVVELTVRRIE